MLFRRYVIDLALRNLSLSGLLLLSKSVSSQMLSVMLYCRCLVINVRGAAVDVSFAPVALLPPQVQVNSVAVGGRANG